MPGASGKTEKRGPSILLAEDDEILRELVGLALRANGYRVFEAASGDQALSLLQRRRFDLLVTDISMPGSLDGWSLAERARLAYPNIMVVYASSRPADTGRQVSHSLYVQKPYHPDAILAAVRCLASRVEPGDGDAPLSGDPELRS